MSLARWSIPWPPQHLPAQQVEVLRRRRRLRDKEVRRAPRQRVRVAVDELQKALEPRRGVLGPLAVISMRQEKHEGRGAAPLGLTASEEVVDDHLRVVGKIAKLHGTPREIRRDQRE